jgi:polyferredoxin
VPLKVDVLRDRSTLSREADDGRIENVFNLHLSNTDEAAHRYLISVSGMNGIEIVGERDVYIPAASSKTVLLAARVEPEAGKKGSNPIFFDVKAENFEDIAVHEKATFFLP